MHRDNRRAELAKIHIAKKDLALDEESYRALLWGVAGVESAADLDAAGRSAVLARLRARGWRPRRKRRPSPSASRAPRVAKIRALLIAAGSRPDAYADAIAKRMFGVDRFEWCTGAQLTAIIAALVHDQRRHSP